MQFSEGKNLKITIFFRFFKNALSVKIWVRKVPLAQVWVPNDVSESLTSLKSDLKQLEKIACYTPQKAIFIRILKKALKNSRFLLKIYCFLHGGAPAVRCVRLHPSRESLTNPIRRLSPWGFAFNGLKRKTIYFFC